MKTTHTHFCGSTRVMQRVKRGKKSQGEDKNLLKTKPRYLSVQFFLSHAAFTKSYPSPKNEKSFLFKKIKIILQIP